MELEKDHSSAENGSTVDACFMTEEVQELTPMDAKSKHVKTNNYGASKRVQEKIPSSMAEIGANTIRNSKYTTKDSREIMQPNSSSNSSSSLAIEKAPSLQKT